MRNLIENPVKAIANIAVKPASKETLASHEFQVRQEGDALQAERCAVLLGAPTNRRL
jgi:hypothetical protein